MNVSRELLAKLIAEIDEVIAHWRALDGPNTRWRGTVVKRVSEQVLEAWDALVDAVDTDEIDEDARELVLAIDRFQEALDEWTERFHADPDSEDPRGNNAVWIAWEGDNRPSVKACLTPRRYAKPQPIAEMVAMPGMADAQIAREYGFVDADGRPDLVKLAEEKAKPGTHYDPATWVNPIRRRHDAEIAEAWAKRPKRSGTPINKPQPVGPAPESLDELIGAGVSAKQIAAMKQITVEDVEQRAAELGLPLDGRIISPTVDPAEAARQREAEAGRVAKERMSLHAQSHPEIKDRDERILSLAVEDWKPKQIADALSIDYPDLTWQKVNGVIQSASAQAAAE